MILKIAAVVTVLVVFAPVMYWAAEQRHDVLDLCVDLILAFLGLVSIIAIFVIPVITIYLILFI